MSELHQTEYATQIFGRRLRELSDAKGSYAHIARDLGINRQQFARYLNGTSRPRDALVRKMAEYFEVEIGTFFQSSPFGSNEKEENRERHAVADALLEGATKFEKEVISEVDLPSGFYMQYKQSFTQPDKVVCMLSRVYRNKLGVVRCKRRYSILVARELPGARVWHTSYGVFVKNLGSLVLFDTDGIAGDLVFSAFRPSSLFSVADRVRTGVVMTHGRLTGIGPVAGRHIIEKIPEDASALAWGRLQGFQPLDSLPDYIRYHFASPESLPPWVIATR